MDRRANNDEQASHSEQVKMPKRTNQTQRAKQWINSYENVVDWFAKWDFDSLLEDDTKIVRIREFLPNFVAEEILAVLQRLPDKYWELSETSGDYEANHSFRKTKSCAELESIFRLFSALFPSHIPSFNAAKYQKRDNIGAHDDRAYVDVKMSDNGSMQLCSRDITLVYYLTKQWTAQMGGAFVDLEDNIKYVPEFNSAVLFRVPHLHQVEPVLVDLPRYSIFGWFLTPGMLYSLEDEEEETQQSDLNTTTVKTNNFSQTLKTLKQKHALRKMLKNQKKIAKLKSLKIASASSA